MTLKIIDAKSRHTIPDLGEVWQHRELVQMLVYRQISSRYKQMLLGGLWAVLEPLSLLALMTVVFGAVLRVDTNGYPYPVFAFAGLIPWLLFSKATQAIASSLQDNMALISKVYFPRLILPLVALIRELFDSLVTVTILIILAAVYGFLPGWKYLLILPALFGVGLGAAALGLWVAALMVRLRDIKPLLTIVLQAGMYLTPILYSPAMVPARFMPIYQLNPMYWAVELFRWILLGQDIQITPSFYAAMGLMLALLVSGMFVFSIYEKVTVDVQ
tara:strand:+ start:2077 stop:2895 length:819 start_codon:yes stop_codon:yes gene_type:complete